jgi:four helix bundle protein
VELQLAQIIAPHAKPGPKLNLSAKIGIVAEEADETVFWIELLSDTGIMKKERLEALRKEAQELTAIFSASRQTAKRK